MSKQKLSLQEQLLKSGLVTSAQAKTAKSDKHKQDRQQRNTNSKTVDEAKALALKAQAEKAERDKELNQLRQQQEQQRQIAAQVKQLIELNRLETDPDGLAYRFIYKNKVKTIYVSVAMRNQIISGKLMIVKHEQRFEVVTAEVAEKLKSRDPACIIVHNDTSSDDDNKDDPYANFQVPDDLIW